MPASLDAKAREPIEGANFCHVVTKVHVNTG